MTDILDRLAKSKFRNNFHLKQVDFDYIDKKGLETIKAHAYNFVKTRLSDTSKIPDEKQTPTKGHPVFIAQHATATCCRECLFKWHKIPKDRLLTQTEIDYVVNIIMTWIKNELANTSPKANYFQQTMDF